MATNKVRYGLKNVHYAKQTGTAEFATPVAIPGAVSLTLTAEGEISKFRADNTTYWQQAANNGYTGELEIARIPDSFRTDILNEIEDKNKVLFELVNGTVEPFALGFQIEGDANETLYWFYNCTATRPTTEASTTEESLSPNTEKLSFSATSMEWGGYEVIRAASTELGTDVTVSKWFEKVYEYVAPSNEKNAIKTA